MTRFLNEHTVSAELDELERSISAAVLEAAFDAAAARLLINGVRGRLHIRQGAPRPAGGGPDAIEVDHDAAAAGS